MSNTGCLHSGAEWSRGPHTASSLGWHVLVLCLCAGCLSLACFLSWADVASYLTNSMPTLERFPISFKTYFSGNYFRHIVLGVNFGGRYGALGMSRREDLMYKPPAFRTLSELVLDYEAAYSRCWHVLKKVKLGQCVSHDPHSVEQIEWKHSVLDVDRLGREDFRKELERHARDMRLKVSAGTAHTSQGPRPGIWTWKVCGFLVHHSSKECLPHPHPVPLTQQRWREDQGK